MKLAFKIYLRNSSVSAKFEDQSLKVPMGGEERDEEYEKYMFKRRNEKKVERK